MGGGGARPGAACASAGEGRVGESLLDAISAREFERETRKTSSCSSFFWVGEGGPWNKDVHFVGSLYTVSLFGGFKHHLFGQRWG